MPRAIKTTAACNQGVSRPGQARPFEALNIMIRVLFLDRSSSVKKRTFLDDE